MYAIALSEFSHGGRVAGVASLSRPSDAIGALYPDLVRIARDELFNRHLDLQQQENHPVVPADGSQLAWYGRGK